MKKVTLLKSSLFVNIVVSYLKFIVAFLVV